MQTLLHKSGATRACPLPNTRHNPANKRPRPHPALSHPPCLYSRQAINWFPPLPTDRRKRRGLRRKSAQFPPESNWLPQTRWSLWRRSRQRVAWAHSLFAKWALPHAANEMWSTTMAGPTEAAGSLYWERLRERTPGAGRAGMAGTAPPNNWHLADRNVQKLPG